LADLSYIGDELSFKCLKISDLLDQIDRAHAFGAAGHILLPQLVVCGDSSAGKSLVLERVTGFPLPRKATRFPTEIILKHHPSERRMTATIVPHPSRDDVEKTRLASFHQPFAYLSELPGIIEAAGQCMGVQTSDDEIDKPAFVADVLLLEVVGNIAMHLKIIDLPGFLSGSENERDAQLVGDLVDSYLENPRTILLAVVPASDDIDTKRITQGARHFDQYGRRKVGIITKPDLINTATKEWVGGLIHSVKWSIDRWFILKSSSPAELRRGLTLREMKRAELDYFAAEPWKRALDSGLTGVDKLRSYLQDVLHRQIELDLPNLLQDLRMQRDENTEELGTERETPHQIRVFLTHISFDFQGLVQGGIDGDYGSRHAGFFNVAGNDFSNRLRAQVHLENQKFANYMREFGETRQIVDHEDALSTEPPIGMPVEGSVTEMGQILLSQKEMTLWVEQVSV
jgi:GTP-binding protein EngB required for normal cell division